jgi:hypothetical protein
MESLTPSEKMEPHPKKATAIHPVDQQHMRCHIPTISSPSTTERIARDFMENVGGASLAEIRRVVDACPRVLAVRSKSGVTPMDVLWRRCFDELHYDSDESELMAHCITKYTSETLMVHSSRLGMLLGPTVTRALASSTTIKMLHLSNLQLTKEGLIGLLQELATNACLETLLFEWITYVDVDVCRSLKRMLQSNVTLEYLTIRSRLLSELEVGRLQTALDAAFDDSSNHTTNKTLLSLHMPLIAQYRLYLSMSLELFDIMDASDAGDWCHLIDRIKLDMYLALNRAATIVLDPEMATKRDFCNMLNQASASWSAQYMLLQRAPHLWSQR